MAEALELGDEGAGRVAVIWLVLYAICIVGNVFSTPPRPPPPVATLGMSAVLGS